MIIFFMFFYCVFSPTFIQIIFDSLFGSEWQISDLWIFIVRYYFDFSHNYLL